MGGLDGVARTTNGGQTWTLANSGLPAPYMQTLVIDPSDPNTIYAGTVGGGIWKSTGGAASWH